MSSGDWMFLLSSYQFFTNINSFILTLNCSKIDENYTKLSLDSVGEFTTKNRKNVKMPKEKLKSQHHVVTT